MRSVQNGVLGVDEFFLWLFFVLFCRFVLFFYFFVMLADGHWTNPALKFLSYSFGGLCSVVLGKPLSVFSGSCLHNPVHTPILSLYRKKNTVNKKN